ncbi:CPBP family intramembrane glutamic endopeptidase [Clostridium aminobutyricum]|uniref:CPBP family intramembrane glutamic endopeptidase n=1 Tax=Clostridium aminobutyricum TaxID=33953 RepID=UPI003CC8C133
MDKKNTTSNFYIAFTLLISAVLWFLMFIIKPMNFWIEMSLSISILVALSYWVKRDLFQLSKITWRAIIIGILSAIILYAVFYVGNIVSGYLFPFKEAQVLSVYSNKSQGSPLLIGSLLLLLIGPGEELFWRGFIQQSLATKLGETKGYLLSTLFYTGVHIVTGNFMLIIAALVCGAFWGFMYKKEKSLVPVIISHALWDFTIFVLFPLIK